MSLDSLLQRLYADMDYVPFVDQKFTDCALCIGDKPHSHIGACSVCDTHVYKPANDWWYDPEDPSFKYCPMTQFWANGDVGAWVDLMLCYSEPALIQHHFHDLATRVNLINTSDLPDIRQAMIDDLTANPSQANKLRYLRFEADIFRQVQLHRHTDDAGIQADNEEFTRIFKLDLAASRLRELATGHSTSSDPISASLTITA